MGPFYSYDKNEENLRKAKAKQICIYNKIDIILFIIT